MTGRPRPLRRRLAVAATSTIVAASLALLPGVGAALQQAASAPLVAASLHRLAASATSPSPTLAATFAGATGSAEELGASVALSSNGQVALVGAPAANGGDGAVYIYAQSAAGTWSPTPVATIPGPSGAKAEFGAAVAVSANGQVVVVGAPNGGPGSPSGGAAYVYAGTGSTWPSTPAATFTGPAGSGAKFGFSVALSADGTIAVVGAPVAGDGSAYLYTGAGGAWASAPATTFVGTDAGGEFGSSVALSANGQVLLLGAPGAGLSYDGEAYLYAQSGSTWSSTPTATFPGPAGAGAELGTGVALSANGQVALLGAGGASPAFDGAAYLYNESGGRWPQSPSVTFSGPLDSDAWMGMSVALSANGQVALLGAPVANDGAAYLYTESGGAWPGTPSTSFIPPPGSPAAMGSSVALSGGGNVSMMGDAPYTGGEAIDGDAYLYSAPAAPAAPAQAAQTITITPAPPAAGSVGATYKPAATASSRLPVSFTIDPSSGAGTCSISGKTVKFTGAGRCVIDANQAGDAAWAAATQVQIDITVRGSSPRVAVASAGVTVSGDYVLVSLSCSGGPCAGTVELVKGGTLEGGTVKGGTMLAEAPYSLATGVPATARAKLTAAGKALLAHARAHHVNEELVVTVSHGTGTTKVVAVS
jgi:hypothetical protein